MIYLVYVIVLINNGKILLMIQQFGKLLIQLIGQEVTIIFNLLFLIDQFNFLGQWDSNIPLEETKLDEDDKELFVRRFFCF